MLAAVVLSITTAQAAENADTESLYILNCSTVNGETLFVLKVDQGWLVSRALQSKPDVTMVSEAGPHECHEMGGRDT
jgi:hypothetical protein